MNESIQLYTIKANVTCMKCGKKGAVQEYGKYYPHGIGELADRMKSYEKYRNTPKMSHSLGFGGTVPYKCINCSNTGLIDVGGFEGYKQAFQTIKK